MAMKGDSLVQLEQKDQQPTVHRKVWTDEQGCPKNPGMFSKWFHRDGIASRVRFLRGN